MAKILVVDDRPINREFLATLLGYAGHRVCQAADGAEALQVVDLETPDLVISDILMPVMDGVEFARRVLGHPRSSHIPVIFYTATHRLTEAQKLAATCGVSTVIPKPSEPQELLDAVHHELGLPTVHLSLDNEVSAAPPPGPAVQIGHQLEDLAVLRQKLDASLRSHWPQINGTAMPLDTLASNVEQSFLRAQALSMRLAAVIELGLDLAKLTDPTTMLAMFCHAAHDVMSAQTAGVCILDENGDVHDFAAWGLSDAETVAVRTTLQPTAGALGDVLRERLPRRLDSPVGSVAAAGLPITHPPLRTLIAVPIMSATRVYGWFYAADRLGGEDFPPGDEQIALTLASQLASEYENRLLLDRVQRHAALLQVEIDERRQASEQLRESELRFRELAENIREVFFLVDAPTGALLYVSPAYAEIWQRSTESLYAQPTSWLDSVHPDDRESAEQNVRQRRIHGTFMGEYRILRPDGAVRWIRSRGFPIRNAAGELYRIAGTAEDITDSKLRDLSLRRLSRIHRVLSGINSAIVRIHERDALLDEACRIARDEGGFPITWIGLFQPNGSNKVVASRGLEPATLTALNEYLGRERDTDWEPARRAATGRDVNVVHDLRAAMSHPSAGPVTRVAVERGYVSLVSLPLLPNGELAGVMMLYAEEGGFFDEQEIALLKELAGDVSFALQYIAKEEQLDYLAYYDPMTGLPNASLFRERLSQAILRDSRSSTALFMLDIARLGQVNDSLGRHVGDQVLASVGKRLQAALPEGSQIARIAGDVFVVSTPPLRQATEAGTMLQEKVLTALNQPFFIEGHELRISARAGVAIYPADGRDIETLLTNAEAALRQAKATGVRYLFYSPQLNAQVSDDLALEQQLLTALDRQEFVLHYQPKVAARSGVLVGVEALLRWRNRKGALVAPDRFIRVLEETELILDVGRWAIEQALRDYKRWRDMGLRPPRVAVNVSPVQLRYADFPEMVIAALKHAEVDGSALELEITESVIMSDIEANNERLQKIADHGVTIAIDDFGTGYSSLRYLAKLPVDTLKIDRSFVVSMAADADSMTLVSTIVSLAHSFDLTVVAEGVDAEDQAQLLRLMKVDTLQGYLFSKPVPVEAIEKLLSQQDQ